MTRPVRSPFHRFVRLGVALATALILLPAGAAAADLWLHVHVEEEGGARVKVNLPLALVEKAADLLPREHLRHFDLQDLDGRHLHTDLEELREMWQEIKGSPDMTFVTVEERDETVKVWKEGGTLHVQVRGASGDERVDVRAPMEVVNAFLAGDEPDFQAAIRALAAHGSGDLVEVWDHRDRVRVWVDDVAEATSR